MTVFFLCHPVLKTLRFRVECTNMDQMEV